MFDHDGGTRTAVRLADIATRAPGVLADMPVIVRGALTGLLARPSSHKSIGTVFQERAARYGHRVFLRFGDQRLTYRDANAADLMDFINLSHTPFLTPPKLTPPQ